MEVFVTNVYFSPAERFLCRKGNDLRGESHKIFKFIQSDALFLPQARHYIIIELIILNLKRI